MDHLLLDKFFCCLSLRSGGITIGCLGVIFGIVGIIGGLQEWNFGFNFFVFGLIWTIPASGMPILLSACVFHYVVNFNALKFIFFRPILFHFAGISIFVFAVYLYGVISVSK